MLGYLAVQTGSVWPPMVYHCVHNSLLYLSKRTGVLEQILTDDLYAGLALCIGTLLAVVIVFRFTELKYGRTKEEALQEAMRRDAAQSLVEPA